MAEDLYVQDFEALDQASLTALGDAGFLGFGTELNADGSVANAYGAFPDRTIQRWRVFRSSPREKAALSRALSRW